MSSPNHHPNHNRRQQEALRMAQDIQHRYSHTPSNELPRGRPTPPTDYRQLPALLNYRPGSNYGASRLYHPPSSAAERRTAFRARANNERHYRNAHERSSSGPRELHRMASQLDAASSTLRALLDDPTIPTMPPPSLPSQSTTNDSASETEPGHRFKRRKLDTDKQPVDYKGFSYGYYGQVVPGQLKMEIVSCDGGSFEGNSNKHAAENVLQDDRSVYCTKANRCNLILRHQGATPFCLEELVIKAPPRDYTAPVQEGMVFVSMTSDDLLERTARYQIQYSSPKRSGRRSSEERRAELHPIISIRHNGDGTISTSQQFRSGRQLAMSEEDDDRQAHIPSEFAVLNSANFNVVTECSDDEEDDEDDFSSPRARIRHRNRSYYREDPAEEAHDDDDDDDGDDTPWHLVESYSRPPRPSRQESSRRETPSQITLAEAVEASQIASQEAVKAVGGGFLPANARFFIEKNKSKCTIKFDPPISGRFILLKMWSPRRETDENIDIQSVVARGYAGPRFFPAQQLR